MIFTPGHKTKIILVTLMDDLRWNMNEGNTTTFVLPEHFTAFNMVNYSYYSGLPANFGNGGHCTMVVLPLPKQVIVIGGYEEVQPLGTPGWDVLNLNAYPGKKKFNLCTKPLCWFGVRYHQYSCDTQFVYLFVVFNIWIVHHTWTSNIY